LYISFVDLDESIGGNDKQQEMMKVGWILQLISSFPSHLNQINLKQLISTSVSHYHPKW
jgi:hypothetical protein